MLKDGETMSDIVHKAYNFAYFLTGDRLVAEQIVTNSLKSLDERNFDGSRKTDEKLFNGIYREFSKMLEKDVDTNKGMRVAGMHLKISRALQRLSPLERAHIVLKDILGFKTRNIASCLGRDEASVRKVISQARLSLSRAVESLSDSS
jgi:DNA-directed RNA polymerase specialized sigma24 family protein